MMTAAARAILTSSLDQSDPATAQAMIGNLNDITGMIIESVLENTVMGGKRMYQRFLHLAEKGNDFQKHPVNVASLAILMTFGIGYSSEKILTDMAMAALLHDIGLSKCPSKVIQLAHDPVQLPIKDREYVYQHSEYTLQILNEKKVKVSELAKTIIAQHHEEFNGYGYPKGLRGFDINELSQILQVADSIDQLLQKSFTTKGNLRELLVDMLDGMEERKSIEITLLQRIRKILV